MTQLRSFQQFLNADKGVEQFLVDGFPVVRLDTPHSDVIIPANHWVRELYRQNLQCNGDNGVGLDVLIEFFQNNNQAGVRDVFEDTLDDDDCDRGYLNDDVPGRNNTFSFESKTLKEGSP